MAIGEMFYPLHLHTTFSIGDAVPTPEDYAQAFVERGFKGGGISDHGTLSGIVRWQSAMLENNLVPLIGIEAYVVESYLKDTNREHIGVYFTDKENYIQFLKLHKKSYTEGFYYKPRILISDLLDYLRSVKKKPVILSGCVYSPFWRNYKLVENFLDALDGKNLYLELMLENSEMRVNKIQKMIIKLHKRYNIPLVFSLDSHFIDRKDEILRRIVYSIAYNKRLDNKPHAEWIHLLDSKGIKYLWKEFYPWLNKKYLYKAFENTFDVMEKAKDFRIPTFKLDEILLDYTYEDLKHALKEGLKRKGLSKNKDVIKQLKYELKIIKEKGFYSYMMTVKDIIDYAKNNDILVGPGRGSVGGSIIAYLLGIISFNPLKHDLIFERFISPDRIEPPDIDMDFQDDKRHQVIDYIKSKYGNENVAQIVAFSYWKEKQIIRDLARITDYNDAKFFSDFPEYIENAGQKLIGKIRHRSKHAAGIVMAKKPLWNYAPVEAITREETLAFDKVDAEKIGLVKFDILGLSTLTIISDTLKYSKKPVSNKLFSKLNKRLDDIKIIDGIYNKKLLAGVFQFDTNNMNRILDDIKINSFNDIVLLNALNRPGPLSSYLDDIIYWKNKNKIRRTYPDWIMDIVKNTAGVFIYQEQIMELAKRLGFNPIEVNKIRKDIAKSKMEELKQWRGLFIKKLKAKGYKEATKLWDELVNFGGYAFNKSHAVAYSILSFATAYLKFKYPLAFYSALIKRYYDNHKKLATILQEAYERGIQIYLPDVENPIIYATYDKEDNGIYLGYAVIKGVGVKAAQKIVDKAPYNDLEHFIKKSKVNINVIKAMAQAGAFDSFEVSRKYIYDNAKELKSSKVILFESGNDWDEDEKFKRQVSVLEFLKYMNF